MTEFTFAQDLREVWLLAATELAADNLRARCRGEGQPAFIGTLYEALPLILSALPGQRAVSRLGETSRRLLLEELLESEQDSASLRRQRALEALRLFDTLRLREVEDAYFYRLVEEQGSLPFERRDAEALIDCLVRYQALQDERGAYDAVGLLEHVFQALERYVQPATAAQTSLFETTATTAASARTGVTSLFQKRAFFFEPEQLQALELSFLRALGRHCPLTFVLSPRLQSALFSDESDCPRYFLTSRRLIETRVPQVDYQVLPEPLPDESLRQTRSMLAERLLHQEVFSVDRERSLVRDAGLLAWRNDSIRSESWRACERIASGINKGTLEASAVQIFCFDVEAYRPFLLEAASAFQLPLSIRKHEGLSTQPFGQFLAHCFDWIEQPSLESGFALFSHPFARPLEPAEAAYGESIIATDYEGFSSLLAELPSIDAAKTRPEISQFKPSLGALQRILTHSFMQDTLTHSLLPQARARHPALQALLAHIGQFVLDNERFESDAVAQAAVREGLEALQAYIALCLRAEGIAQLRDSSEPFKEIGGILRSTRRRLSESGLVLDAQRAALARSARAANRMFLRSRRHGQAAGGGAGQNWEQALRVLREYLHETPLAALVESDDIWVSEFLDLRSLARPHCLLLGASSSAMYSWLADSQSGESGGNASEVEELRRVLLDKDERLLLSQELLSRAFTHAETLVLSYFESDASAEYQPSPLLPALASLPVPAVTHTALAALFAATESECSPEQPESPATMRRLLEARASSQWTAFDTLLDPASIPLSAERVLRLSATALELYLKDPFGYFLSHQLGLADIDENPLESIHIHAGTVVHRSLERFLKQKHYRSRLQTDFEGAKRGLATIAEEEFRAIRVDWDAHPYLRARRELCLSGLRDRGVAGPLLIALQLERDLLETEATRLELRFGGGGKTAAEAFHLEVEGKRVEFRGVIDRLDFERADDETITRILALWDYKTGKAASKGQIRDGKSFQIPLYAAWCRQVLGILPQVAGVLQLSVKEYSDKEYASPTQGPRRVLMGPESPVLESELEASLQKLREILSQLLAGRCMQQGLPQYPGRAERALLYSSDLFRLARKSLGEGGNTPIPRETVPTVRQYDFVRAETLAPLRSPSPEQERACDTSCSISLQAGAGSGKTFVLQTRVLRLIAEGVPLRSILAITFTKKATEEMRSRIAQGVRAARLRETAPEVQARFDAALRELPYLEVQTIHSFCSALALMEPALSGRTPRMRLLNEAEVKAASERALQDVIVSESGRSRVERLLQHGLGSSRLEQSVLKLARDDTLREGIAASAQTFREGGGLREQGSEMARTLLAYRRTRVAELLTEAERLFGTWCPDLEQYFEDRPKMSPAKKDGYRMLLAAVQQYLEALPPRKEVTEDELKNVSTILNDFLAVQPQLSGNSLKRVKGDPRYFYKECSEYFAAVKEVLELLDSPASQLERELALTSDLCALAEATAQHYRAWKQKHEVFDFDDQIRTAHQMLCGSQRGAKLRLQKRLHARLHGRFRHIMVDEFQDTDPLQWDIVKALAAGSSGSAEAAKIFLVGDLQQSIYRFRGGDARVFKRAEAELLAQGALPLRLQDNYRSHPEIIRFVNCFFEGLFALDLEAPRVVETAVPLTPMNAKLEAETTSEARIAVLSAEEQGRRAASTADDDNEDEGPSLEASEVAQLLSFVSDVINSHRDSERETRYPELNFSASRPQIALLCRRKRELMLLAHAFDRRGIPYAMSDNDSFYERDEVSLLTVLLKLLEDTSNPAAIVGVLRSPIVALDDTQLLRLARSIDFEWPLLFAAGSRFSDRCTDAELRALLAPIQAAVPRWIAAARVARPSALLSRILEESGLASAYAALGYADSYAGICLAIDALRHAERTAAVPARIDAAARWFQVQREKSAPVTRAPGSEKPVVLSTIHAAKGLEYPMVILPFLASSSRGFKELSSAECTMSLLRSGAFSATQVEERRPLLLRNRVPYDRSGGFYSQRSLASAFVEEREESESCSEERRLFYVGCTRAMRYLILSYGLSADARRKLDSARDLPADARRNQCRKTGSAAQWLELLSEGAGFIYRSEDGVQSTLGSVAATSVATE